MAASSLTPVTFPRTLGTVGQVASAVIAVVGAIPTGGTSLVALVPNLIALAGTVTDNLPAIAKELFKSEQKHLDAAREAYETVQKDVEQVIGAGKAVVDLIGAVDKLTQGAKPDTARHVQLVAAAAEAAHALMLSQMRLRQADLQVEALQAKADRASALSARLLELEQQGSAVAKVLREAALTLVQVAQVRRDTLLGFVFLAQRSLEIVTVQSQAANVYLDSGYVHPDVERDYAEGLLTTAELVAQYQLSWTRFLSPIRMQADYLDYFRDPVHDLVLDSRRRSVTDPQTLARFAASHRLEVTVDLADLPADHVEAKIQAVAVGLPGATSQSDVVSCQVWHGPAYGQLRPDGSAAIQLLRPHMATVQAPVEPLQLAGVDFPETP